MRRIDSTTKEMICWVRSAAVQASERLEFHRTIYSKDDVQELIDINEALNDSYESSISKVLAIEVNEILNEFGLDERHATSEWSAFPHLKGQVEFSMNESIVEYTADLIKDLLTHNTIPAIEIADEFEEWLNDLYDFHVDNQKESE